MRPQQRVQAPILRSSCTSLRSAAPSFLLPLRGFVGPYSPALRCVGDGTSFDICGELELEYTGACRLALSSSDPEYSEPENGERRTRLFSRRELARDDVSKPHSFATSYHGALTLNCRHHGR